MLSSITGSPSISSVSDLAILTPDECNGDDDGRGDELSLGAMMSSLVERSFPCAVESSAYLHNFPSLFCPLCLATGSERVFNDVNALIAHILSATQAEKAFRYHKTNFAAFDKSTCDLWTSPMPAFQSGLNALATIVTALRRLYIAVISVMGSFSE